MIDPQQMQAPPTPPLEQQPFSPAPAPLPTMPPEPTAKPKPEKHGDSFQELVAREYDRLLHTVASGAAKEQGSLPDSHDLTKDDEAVRWEHRNPKIKAEQLPMVADQIALGIVQKYTEAGKPLPDQQTMTRLVAAQVNRVWTEGQRRELVSRGFPQPKSQVDRAKGLARRYGPKPDDQQPAQQGGY